jgi:hypothetical protein
MRPRIAAAIALVAAAAPGSSAQTLFELRGATTKYRFVDLSHAFRGGLVLDALYTGVPGMNELYLGAGHAWRPIPGLTLTPIAYAVAGFENGQRGLTLGALVSLDRGGYRSAGFAGRFVRVDGDVASYTFADSLDLTRVLGDFELGASLGFFRQQGSGSWQLGPTLKRNDARGSWALALRFGSDTELRLIRIVSFGAP